MDACAFRHRNHQAVEGDLIAGHLPKPTVEIIGVEAAGIIQRGIAKHHQGDGFTWQGSGQVADHFEDRDAPLFQGGVELRCGNALDLVDTHDIAWG